MSSTLTLVSPDNHFEDRISALIDAMTLREKVGQLTQFNGSWNLTGPEASEKRTREKNDLLQSGLIGSVLNAVGVEDVRALQKCAVENSRLGIPMLFGYDVIHGQQTMFPVPLAEAASWDLDHIELSARITAVEAAAQGVNWTFAPMVDVSRDPRWGRVMEGSGEDPFLGSAIAIARVNGLQGDDLTADDTVAATLKHFAAYGFAESGKDYNTAEISSVTLHNVVLPPFRAALEAANPRSVMNAFNTVNGVPATADGKLQRDLLKGKWGFDGVVISDWGSMIELINHGVAEAPKDAARLSILAGSDIDMESCAYIDHLEDLVQSRAVSEALVDDAVRRLLRLKFELGLFDDPYRYLDAEREKSRLMTDAHFEASLDVARRSIVLLKNDDRMLPLKPSERIALIGPLANDKDAPLGNWRAHAEPHSATSVVEGCHELGVDYAFAEGVKLQIGDAQFTEPVQINHDDRSGFEEAIAAAREADKVVIVLGETARQSGEGRSRTDLGFPGLQQELLEAVQAVNPNVILVVMSGRPLVLSWSDAHLPCIVQAWHLGQRAGRAIADVLTGAFNPSGKLPMSFPRTEAQIPIYYNHLNTGRPGPRDDVVWSHYNDEQNTPLFPFGHGLSFTDFAFSDLKTEVSRFGVKVSVTVTNTGSLPGDEVVQLYIRDRVAKISRPVRELKGFQKLFLASKDSDIAQFTLTGKELGYYDPDGEFVLEPGIFDLFVGGSSAANLSTAFTITAEHVARLRTALR